jgi:hypothetical protein
LLAPGGERKPGAQAFVDLAPGVAQRGRLQPVAADPKQADALGHRPQQLDGVPLDDRTPTRPRRRSGRPRRGSLWMTPRPELAAADRHSLTEGKATPLFG